MALTRPRLGQLNTSSVAQSDPITLLNQGASSANIDVGFLFNRANGLVSNVALYWSESAQSIVTAYTSSSGATDSNISVSSYANLTIGNLLMVNGSILNVTGNVNVNTVGTHYGNIVNSNVLLVSNTTSSTSTTSGALQVAGGAGIAGNLYVGGNLDVTGTVTFRNSVVETSTELVQGVEIVAGNLVANAGTASTSTTTGALVVLGGAGITGNVSGNIGFGSQLLLTGNVTNSLTATSLDTLQSWQNTKSIYIGTTLETTVTGIYVKSDGTKAYMVGQTNDRVYEQTLSTPYDISTASNVAAVSVLSQDTTSRGIWFKPDGTKMYIAGGTSTSVYEYTLGTAWSANSAVNVGVKLLTPTITSAYGVQMSTDGTKMFVGQLAGNISMFTLSTPWSVNSASYTSGLSTTAWETNLLAFSFNSSGTSLVVYGSNNKAFVQYNLGTAYDLTTATFVARSQYDRYNELNRSTLVGMHWLDTQNYFYVTDYQSDEAIQYQTNISGLNLSSTSSTRFANTVVVDGNFLANNVYLTGNIITSATGITHYLNGTTTVNGLTGTGTITFSATTSTISVGTSQTTGNTIIGATSQTGNVNIGPSTANITYWNWYGATSATNTKNINLATGGLAGSFSNLQIGPIAGTGNVYFQSGTFVNIANTASSTSTTTGALVVAGGVGIAGNLYVGGNLTISGSTTTINNTTIETTEFVQTIDATTIRAVTMGNIGANMVGTGTYLTSLNASNLSSGTVPSAQISGSYTGITAVGTLTGLTVTGATTTANITAGGITSNGTVQAATVNAITIGNTGATLTGTLSTAAQTNITSVGTLTGLTSSGAVSITNSTASTSTGTGALIVSGGTGIAGNVFAGNVLATGFFYANGTPFVSSTYGNAQVLANLASTSPTTIGNIYTTNGIYWANGAPYTVGTINPAIYFGGITATTSPTLIDTIPVTGNNLVRWTTTSYDSTYSQYRSSTIDSINNGTTVTYTEYGVLVSNVGTTVATFTSNITSGNINLWATGNTATVAVTFERVVLGSNTSTGYLTATGPAGPTGATGATGTIANTASWIVTTNTTTSTSTTTGALQVTGGAGIAGNVYASTFYGNIGGGSTTANVFVSAHITPTANITYDIGTPTQRFRSLYLSGNTIDLGGASIKTDATTGAIAFVPQPTTANPNPVATVVSPAGTITTVTTTGGNITSSAFSTASNTASTGGNVTVGNLTVSNTAVITNTTVSTSATTGALQVAGGAGIAGAVYAGSIQNTPIGSTTASTGNFTTLNATGTFTAATVNAATIGNSGATLTGTLSTAAQTNITSVGNLTSLSIAGVTTNWGNLVAASGTASTNTTTGALVVTGGAGIAGALYNGGVHVSSGNIVAASGTASSSTTTGALTVVGGAGISGNVVADQVHALNNGNGTNFKVGDDVWLGDINVANTMGMKGLQDATQAYIVFGNSNNTNYIGRSGTNPITVTGAFSTTGSTTVTSSSASTSTTTGALVVTGGVGVSGSLNLGGDITTPGVIKNASGRTMAAQTGGIIQTQYVSSGTRVAVDFGGSTWGEPSTAYRVSITPQSTSSYFVVHYHVPGNPAGAYMANTIFMVRAFRLVGGTKTYALTSAGTDSAGSRAGVAGMAGRPSNGYDYNDLLNWDWVVVDAPATTSQVTYGFEFRRESGGTGTVTFGQQANTNAGWGWDANILIVVQEIAQ